MKKIDIQKLFAFGAVALASGLACAQSSTVQLYGIVDMAFRHTNNEGPATDKGQSLNQMVGGGMSQSRWGINVSEDLGGGTKALVNLENRFGADTGTPTTPYFMQSWVGLQGNYGRLTMGRQYNMLFDLVSSTYASFPNSPYMDVYKPELGLSMGSRANNMVKYMAEVGAVRGALQYSFDEGNTANALTPAASIPAIAGGAVKTAGGYLRYAADGLAAGAGYLSTRLPGGTKVDAWSLGGSYRTGAWYVNLGYGLNKRKDGYPAGVAGVIDSTLLGAAWTGSSNGGFFPGGAVLGDHANKRDMVTVGLGYQLTPQINLGAHYFHAKQSGSASGAFSGKADFMVAALDYAFSKRTDAYFAVDHTRVSGGAGMTLASNGARDRTGITAGLRHRF